MTTRKKFIIEFVTLFLGISLFIFPLFEIQNIYGDIANQEYGQDKLHIQVNYADCDTPNEPLLTLKKIKNTNNVEVTLDFINWRSYEVNCKQIIVDTPSKVSNIEHSKRVGGITPSSLWPIDDSSVTWDMVEQHTYIDINDSTAPSFSGRIRFIVLDSVLTDRTGYQLASSFGISGKSTKNELPFFKYVKVVLEPYVKIDFTVPSIHAIDLNKWNIELTFKVDSGLDTDIFTDVMISAIDQRSAAEREITLSWLSTIMGTGFGLIIGAILAISRDYIPEKVNSEKRN